MILQGENIVSGGSSLPIGSITATVSDTPDIGYLFCHGQDISRIGFPILFAKIGTKYGAGDGSTTFNLPDCREASLVGAGTNVLNASAIDSHNALIAGQFQDDQMQRITGKTGKAVQHQTTRSVAEGTVEGAFSYEHGTTGNSSGGNTAGQYIFDSANSPNARTGDVTHGKQLGVNYQIKVSNHGILPVNAIDDTQITNANTWSAEYITAFVKNLASPSITGSCTTNGTTDNTLVLTGIVSSLALEVGDVIQITGSTDGLNDKPFTVESITDDNSIIVNYEHAGNRGNGSLKLADETATVTIKRISKWYNAQLGIGQAWLDMSSSRTHSTAYTNSTGKPIYVSITAHAVNNNQQVTVNDVVVAVIGFSSAANITRIVSFVVPSGGIYKIDGEVTVMSWSELR